MTQPINSREANALGMKSKVNTDLYPTLACGMDSTKNSVGLVDPSVLESFFQYTTLELIKRKNNLIAPTNRQDDVAERAINTKKTEVLPTRVLRSAGKYSEFNRELKKPSDFSIENIDWYHEDENYYKRKLEVVLSDFAIPKENRREGNQKLSYTYLLLDSRRCRNKANISWTDFIEAIFYIGKGINKRAFWHAQNTEQSLSKNPDQKKFLKIKEIWDTGNPIEVLFATEDIIAEEAYTREAAMIDAITLKKLCNINRSSYYGVAVTMKERERLELGATLLIEARNIFRRKETVNMYLMKKTVIVPFVRPKVTTTTVVNNMDWYYKNENYYKNKLHAVLSDFTIRKPNRRNGNENIYYNFLLLDSRRCRNKSNISWIDFIEAIFYIGSGKNDRAVKLTEDAERASDKTSSKQLFLKIQDIWNSGNTVKVFLATENIIAEEAFTRKAAMIDAMNLNRLCNERRGSYYEKAKTMKPMECFELGATLLIEARDKFSCKQAIDVYPK